MAAPELLAAPASPAARPTRARKRRLPLSAVLSIVWLAVLAAATLAFALGAGADPLANDYEVLSAAPSAAHPFGTDNLGRDVLSRSLHGAGASAVVALTTVVIGGGCGMILGVWAGIRRGFADALVGFLTDVAIALPGMIIVATIVALSGPSLSTIALTIAVFSIPVFARLTRAATLSVATENFVIVARTLGAGPWRILTREVLPAVFPMMLPFLMTTIAGAIVAEGSLSFIGFGLRPPEPSWGGMVAEGRTQLVEAPWVTLFPSLLICLTVLSINVLGEHFREARR